MFWPVQSAFRPVEVEIQFSAQGPCDVSLSGNATLPHRPSDVLPSNVLPSNVLPSNVLPSDVLPSDVLGVLWPCQQLILVYPPHSTNTAPESILGQLRGLVLTPSRGFNGLSTTHAL